MERESFESERIAKLLNDRFVPIKVKMLIPMGRAGGPKANHKHKPPHISQPPKQQNNKGGPRGEARRGRRVHGLHPGGHRGRWVNCAWMELFGWRICSNTLTHNMIYAGGWPMTVFITPNGRKPFTGGTYFPEARFAAILEKCV